MEVRVSGTHPPKSVDDFKEKLRQKQVDDPAPSEGNSPPHHLFKCIRSFELPLTLNFVFPDILQLPPRVRLG